MEHRTRSETLDFSRWNSDLFQSGPLFQERSWPKLGVQEGSRVRSPEVTQGFQETSVIDKPLMALLTFLQARY